MFHFILSLPKRIGHALFGTIDEHGLLVCRRCDELNRRIDIITDELHRTRSAVTSHVTISHPQDDKVTPLF